MFRIVFGAQNKLAHLLQPPLAVTYSLYVTWLTGDYSVMTWLFNILEEKISGNVMFLTTAKKMWETLKVMYRNEKKPSRVFEIYERLSELKQGDKSMFEIYGELKSLIDELEMH